MSGFLQTHPDSAAVGGPALARDVAPLPARLFTAINCFWLRISPICLGVMTAMLVGVGVSRLLFPYDLGHYEGGVWAPAQIAAAGENPYARFRTDQPPYVMALYGPLYYLLVGMGLDSFGTQFRTGRVLSLASFAVCVLSIGILTWRATRNRRATLLAVVCFLSLPPVHAWLGLQRPDFVALAFSLLAITVAILPDHPSIPAAALAAMFLAASILCRQTAVVPVAVVAYWYWSTGANRALACFAATFGGLTTGVIAYMDQTSNGGYVWQNFVLASGVPKSASNVWSQTQKLLTSPAILVMAGALVWTALRPHRVAAVRPGSARHWSGILAGRPFETGIGLFLMGSTAVSLVTCSRSGANINYWLEPCAAASILLGTLWVRPPQAASEDGRSGYGIVLSLLVCGSLFSLARNANGELYRWRSRPYLDGVVAAVRECPDGEPCFAVYPDLVAAAGKPYFVNDFCQYDGRSPEHRAVFDSLFQNRTFSAILSHTDDPPGGYVRVQLAHPMPRGVYPVFLFVRE